MQVVLSLLMCGILTTHVAAQEHPVEVLPQEPISKGMKQQPQGIPTVVLPFENLGIYDALPDYTKSMSDVMFMKWAKAQNAMAYKKAQQRADEWAARNPALDTYIQDNNYNSTSTLDQTEGETSSGAEVSATSGTKYNGRSVQRTYRDRNRWGGGPVLVINPYVRAN